MAVRTFEVLSAYGWTEVEVHKISPGSVVRALDDATPIFIAPDMLGGDTGLYFVAQVQKQVLVSVGTDAGPTEVAIDFTG